MAPTLIIGVVSVVAAVAVGFAFKELIYEPFIAPIVEDWQEEFGPRRRRYPNEPYSTDYYYDDDTVPLRRSDPSVELDSLAAGEMREWRGGARVTDPTAIRQRRPGVDTTIPATSGFEPMRSSHVIFDSSAGPSTATQSPYLTPTRSRSGTPAMPDAPPLPKKDQVPPVHARGLSQASSIRAASRPAAIQAELGRGNEIGAFPMSSEIPLAQLGRPNVPVSPTSSSFSPSGSAYGAASRSAFASPVLRTTGVPPTVKFQQPTPISATATSPNVMHRRLPSEQRSQGTTSPTSPTMFASALQWQADVAAHEPLSSPSILPSEIGSPVIIPRPNIEATGPAAMARSPPRATHRRSSLGLAQPPRVTSPFSDAMSIGTEHWSEMEGHTSAQPPRVASPVDSHHSMQIIDHPAIMDDHVSVRSHASTGSHVDPRSPDVGVTALSDDDDDLSVVSHGTGWESISSAGRVAANGRPNTRPTSS